MASTPPDEAWNANEKFQELCAKLLNNLEDKITLWKPSDACQCEYHLLGVLPIEHPNIHKHWGCDVSLYMGLIPAEGDPEKITVDSRTEIIPEALEQIKKIDLELHKIILFTMVQPVTAPFKIRNRYSLQFIYKGPSSHPALSEEMHAGGDAHYLGKAGGREGWFRPRR